MMTLRLKFILIAVIFHYSIGYSQVTKPTITTGIIGSDTVFIINRAYAEFTAKRFDSLYVFKTRFNDCLTVVDSCRALINYHKDAINIQKDLLNSCNAESILLRDKIDSYKRTESLYTDLLRTSGKDLRRKKLWRGIAIAGITSTSVLGALLAVLK